MLDWDDLKFFAALADEGSLSGAARRLKVDHATVARRVAALEARLGTRLVDRRPRRYLLTAEGERVALHARRMETESHSLERALMAAEAGRQAEVSISAPPLLAMDLIAPKIAAFSRLHPWISLRITGETREASLSRREADIALRLSRPDNPALIIRRAATLSYGLYAAPDYLAARKPEDYGFLAFDDTLEAAPQQQWLKGMAAGRAIVFRSNDLGILRAAAESGLGVAVLPDALAHGRRLAKAAPAEAAMTRDSWITFHADLRGNAAVTAAAGFLAACLAEATKG